MSIPIPVGGRESQGGRPSLDLLALWILFSSWCSLAGWALSLFDALNPWGYAIAFLAAAGVLAIFRRSLIFGGERSPLSWHRLLRSRWLFPKIWLLLALLAFTGGLLYHPVNYDYLTYHFPRVLYWSWEHHWYWIPTQGDRVNYSGTVFEWMMTPLFIVFQTDRLFFLINFVSFLFLPGLVFSVFRQLGISPRIAWWWMWILPTGYCFILQAAGTGNDSFAAIYLLASLHYALKAGSVSSRHLALSLLAVALLTGVKASNLPLALPWLAAVFFQRRQLLAAGKPGWLIPAVVLSAIVSFLPIAMINIHFTGDYSGDPKNTGMMKLSNPVMGVVGNSIQAAVDNFTLPLWYKPLTWDHLIPSPVFRPLVRDFPRFLAKTGEIRIEEDAGAGLGLSVAAVFMILLRFRAGLTRSGTIPRRRPAVWISAAGVVALLAYMSKMGSESTARLIAPYYPLLIAGILVAVSLDGALLRRSAGKLVGGLAMLSAAPLLFLNPLRPLFPVNLALEGLARASVSPVLVQRAHKVYDTYGNRLDRFHDLRVQIPSTEKAVGFIHVGNEAEVSLWLPFHSREVVDLTPDLTLAQVQAKHLHDIIVGQIALTNASTTIDDLRKRWSATVIDQKAFVLRIKRGPEVWYLLRVP